MIEYSGEGIPIDVPLPAENIRYNLGLQYVAELWVNVTRGFIDSSGSEEALSKLKFYIQHSGMSLGYRIAEKNIIFKNRTESALGLIITLHRLHQKKLEVINKLDCIEGIIDECPFAAGSPPEICSQYEAFYNGYLQVTNPDYEFKYDRMMTRGDNTCHWLILKKKTLTLMNDSQSSESPIDYLKKRYVRGEINEEEYRRMKKVLDE